MCVCMHVFLSGYLSFTEWEGGMKEETVILPSQTVVEVPSSFLHAALKNEPQVFSCFFWYEES